MDEQSRPDANIDERAYTLTVEEAILRYQAAGHARTPRALQKYCARGDLDCVKEDTTYGQRYRITAESVVRHLEQIEQTSQANGRVHSRPDASGRAEEPMSAETEMHEPSVREQPRPDANDSRYVVQLEKENVYLREQNDKKDKQLERRDDQIEAMIERDRETNILIRDLQQHLPQLAQGERHADSSRTEIISTDRHGVMPQEGGDNFNEQR